MSGRALDALCAALDVGVAYDDAGGRRIDVPEAAKCAVLAALGYALTPGREDDDAAAHLAHRRATDAARVLPSAVIVEGEGASLRLSPRLPAAFVDQPLRWRIVLETGGERTGVSLARRADAAGGAGPEDEGGDPASDDPLTMSLRLAVHVPFGQHRLTLAVGGPAPQALAAADLFVCPPSCFDADQASDGKRLWGPAVQVHALRSSRNWGVGDFGDLRQVVDVAADAGAQFVGVNPLHALFPHDAERVSPYRPSNREWLNVLYLDCEAMRDFGECREARERVAAPEFATRVLALREAPLVDYAAVAALKFELFELLYGNFRRSHLERATQRAGLFRDFQRAGGRSLRLHALFDTLQRRFHALDASVWGWPAWPAAYHDARGAAAESFELDNEDDIEFFEYLQWQAEGQLDSVAQRARARGMRVGLYRDLAVGVSAGGSETWSQPALFARDAQAGTPADGLNRSGEDWGFPPPLPQQRSDGGFAAFLAILRANMRHAGALRIDHAMSLMRLFWLSATAAGDRVGAYVGYPMHDLFRLLCMESQRQRCIVIGEDLGVVPAEFCAAMSRYGVLAYRPLTFEHTAEERVGAPPPSPRQALAVVATHDLPPLHGYWSGSVPAVYRWLAGSASVMAAVEFEDVLGQLEAVHLPGTSAGQNANWRRKIAVELAAIAADPRWRAVAGAMNAERSSAPLPVSGGPRSFHPESADIPRATYRLQLHGDFGFADAERLLPYLAELGVSHVYASPFLKARPGSRHGYDIVDHQAINPEIGSSDDFDRYCARLAELGMSQVIDVVPNHVGVLGADNPWWLDVLENGPASEYAEYFDIDWERPDAELHGKVLLPVLGDQYGVVLEAGELTLDFCGERGEFSVRYFEHRFPIDPADYPLILDGVDDGQAEANVAVDEAAWISLLAALRNLPPRTADDANLLNERRRNKEIFKKHLGELYARLPALRARIAACLAAFAGHPGEAPSFDALDGLLERQAYRLASWRVAADDINYRRFFDVNDLAALRVENDAVFAATHAQIFRWLAEGRVSGLRIDHPDGLSDPAAYFERLQSGYADICRAANVDATPPALYVVVEKIVGEFEALPGDWPVHGDTGYRFASFCNNVFVDAANESKFSRIYRAFTGETRDFSEVLLEARKLIMTQSLAGELGTLTHLLHGIAQHDRRTRDFTRSRLRAALIEIVAGFPVYRSYIGARGITESDRRSVERAVDDAVRRGLAGDVSVLHYVRDVLFSAPGEAVAAVRQQKLTFARRFQQFTAPVMAKAMEDTAFYRYTRLVSLNDVGGDPRTFGTTVDDFHAACERLSFTHPFGLLASSTHDSKRSEDARARIDVLSEMPGAWRLALRRWGRTNARRKSRVGTAPAPSSNDEYLLYQTLIGIWPMQAPDIAGLAELSRRVEAYMIKATREAKQHTSWVNPEPAYEAAISAFVKRLLTPGPTSERFFADFLPFQALVAHFGCLNSLNMLLLKLTAPGVPDTYQGCELWNLSLVDPDNRRAVDFAGARDALAGLQRDFPDGPDAGGVRRLVAEMADGRIKLYVLWRVLQARSIDPLPFGTGRYLPLEVSGPAARHVVAFARIHEKRPVIVIATRLLYAFANGDPTLVCDAGRWAATVVAVPWQWRTSVWRDALSGRNIAPVLINKQAAIDLSSLFDALPLALLSAQESAGEEATTVGAA